MPRCECRHDDAIIPAVVSVWQVIKSQGTDAALPEPQAPCVLTLGSAPLQEKHVTPTPLSVHEQTWLSMTSRALWCAHPLSSICLIALWFLRKHSPHSLKRVPGAPDLHDLALSVRVTGDPVVSSIWHHTAICGARRSARFRLILLGIRLSVCSVRSSSLCLDKREK